MLKCFLQFIMHWKVRFWHDRVSITEVWISGHSVFASVCVQVRQWGARKLHPYNSDAQRLFFMYAQFGINFRFWGHNDSIFLLFCYWLVLLVWLVCLVPWPVGTLAIFWQLAHCPYHASTWLRPGCTSLATIQSSHKE